MRGQGVPLTLRNHGGERPALLRPAGAPPDGVLLPFFFGVAVSADGAIVARDAGFEASDLRMVAAREVIVQQAELPSRASSLVVGQEAVTI